MLVSKFTTSLFKFKWMYHFGEIHCRSYYQSCISLNVGENKIRLFPLKKKKLTTKNNSKKSVCNHHTIKQSYI